MVQHTPCTSTTPLHGAVLIGTGALQVGPAHPGPHTHTPPVPHTNELYSPTLAQSALVEQAHGASTHTSTLVGLDDDVAAQLLPLTTKPVLPSTHNTARPRLPGPHECDDPYAFTALQDPHDDVIHTASFSGHENRLHCRTAMGGHRSAL